MLPHEYVVQYRMIVIPANTETILFQPEEKFPVHDWLPQKLWIGRFTEIGLLYTRL
jgi:hypothetical protein